MKNRIVLHLMIIGLSASFLKCVDKSAVEDHKIEVETNFSTLKDLQIGDYFRSVRYLPLESHDSCLIDNDPIIHLFKDHILINSNSGSYLFDKENGKFIRSIGHIGNDPGGYKDRFPWIDPDRELIYYNGWKNEYVIYNLSGEYLGKLALPGENKLRNAVALDKDKFIGYTGDLFVVEPERLLYFDEEGKDTLRILTEPRYESMPIAEIGSISVMKTSAGLEQFGPVALQGVISLTGKDPDKVIHIFPNYQPFWEAGNKYYFKEEFNDTIYRIESDHIVPERIFNLGSFRWLPEERLDKIKGNGIYISQILEGEKEILFRFVKGMHSDDMKRYMGIYTKSSGKVSVGLDKKGIADDSNHFLPIYPFTVSPWGEYAAFLAADEVREWIDENLDVPSSLTHLKNIREDDNPVVVFFK